VPGGPEFVGESVHARGQTLGVVEEQDLGHRQLLLFKIDLAFQFHVAAFGGQAASRVIEKIFLSQR